ncbi:MAG: MBL fold metallo-hydrolase [Pseudolabrys sp.]|nr:MBL fold metallo-hydrolase [Pseudolabrys sp.]
MIDLSRRTLLAAAAAVPAAGAAMPILTTPAKAAAGNATGVYRYKVGDAEIVQLADGARTFPLPDGFIVNLDKDKTIAATAAAYMPAGQMTIPFSPMVVNTGSKLVAIDTGNGLGAFAASKGAVGQTRGNMEVAGIDPAKVDIVLISHFHGDHIGGLRNADGSPAYPNAEIKVPATEYAFWMDDANQSKANGFNKGQFASVKKTMDGLKVTQYDAGKEVAPGITSIATPGHTPGHTSFVIASGNGKIMVQSDVCNVPLIFMEHPERHAVFDNDGALAETTRRKFYDMVAAEKMMVTGYHFPFPCVGHVEKSADGYRLVPIVG